MLMLERLCNNYGPRSEGNVFTGVCHSVNNRPCGCLVRPLTLVGYSVTAWPVRFLLECFLVCNNVHMTIHNPVSNLIVFNTTWIFIGSKKKQLNNTLPKILKLQWPSTVYTSGSLGGFCVLLMVALYKLLYLVSFEFHSIGKNVLKQ